MDPKTLRNWLARILDLLGISSPQRGAEAGSGAPAPKVEDAHETDAGAAAPGDAASTPEATAELVPLDGDGRKMLREIRKFASWEGEDGQRLRDEVCDAFAKAYPGHEQEVDQAIRQGQGLRGICEHAYRSASIGGAKSPEVASIRERVKNECAWGMEQVEKSIQRGLASRQRWNTSKANKGKPRKPMKPRTSKTVAPTLGAKPLNVRSSTLPVPSGLHGSDLRAQAPSAKWTIVIDESGSDFGPDMSEVKPARQGRFVAVVIPGNPPALPALPKAWHAVDCTDDREIDRVFQAVLSAEVAVFGATVFSLPVTPGERWADGVALLIDWILRLLPVDGPTEVEVLVENRGMFKRGDQWPLIERDCLRRLALAFPQTAGWIDLRIRVVGKDDCEHGGYADAVAYTWARTSPESKARMTESLLTGSCLLEAGARSLLGAWDSFAQGVRLPGSDWWRALPHAANPASLAGTLLASIGRECAADRDLWNRYLDETRRQMAGGAVELARLADATAWLERHIPEDADIPPLMRLAWLIVKLARSNHYGDAESAWEGEVKSLASALLDEAAPLVCHADLHLAVARTNRFDFEGASRALDRWTDQPVAVPGLRYWGQVRSSLGQHAAFTGNQAAAVALFDEALAAFARLSDSTVRDKEAKQTGAYRAIALMDQTDAPDETVHKAVEDITGPIGKAISRLATSDSPEDRYAHHLLLRWLVRRGKVEEQASYLGHRPEWQTGHGHPWPLIQLYRALLLHPAEPDAARQLAMEAAELAFGAQQGPVVRLIGACCRVFAAAWGEPWPEAAGEFDELEAALPGARDRVAVLREALDEPGSPLNLLAAALPFNFR